ncbi:uncharacterized protein [Panulirus ornatus]|uniref:uncharacterized protein isoform X2 n=1 Tax=Panulirus ornatus TaxID=150431 RepID=UPI003A8ACAD2
MTSLDNPVNISKAEVVTEILNVTEGEEALDLAGNDNSKSLDISQASVESESTNSEGMDTTADSTSESALQSPDSAIGGTPTLTPDQEFQNRLPEKPVAEIKPIEEAQTVQEPVKVDQEFTTTELESQNGNDEENQSISISSSISQMPKDSEEQRLEENSARGEIQSSSDILEEDSSSSSSTSSIVIVEREDVEDGRENDEEIRSEKSGLANLSVSKHSFAVANEKNEMENLSATRKSEPQSEKETLCSEDNVGDEASPKLMVAETLQLPQEHDEIHFQKSATELKQEKFAGDRMPKNIKTDALPISQYHDAKSLLPSNVHETRDGFNRDSDNTTEEIVPTESSALEEVTELKLDNSCDVNPNAPVLSSSAAAEILDSRVQQPMCDEIEEKTSPKIMDKEEREDNLKERWIEETLHLVNEPELKTAEVVEYKDREDLQENANEESGQIITQKPLGADASVTSDAGYEEDDEDEGEVEEDISENEMVVSGSMQFPLAEKDQKESLPSGRVQLEQQEHPTSQEVCTPSESSAGVTVQVSSQILQASPKESPSGFESDVEDNDEDSREESLVSLSKPVLETTSHSSDPMQLPDTVSRLDTPEGSSVFLVGTAHFSKESQEDVANTIRIVKPDIVVVELCKARTAILQLDEETILQESRSLDLKKIQMILRQHGKIQGVLYLLLLSVSAHITKQLGMAPGGEFRTAFAEARKSAPGCLIQLGDRPIQITLSRALASLSLWHKFKLTWHILTSKEPISKEEVEKCKQRDFIEEMLAEMTGQFPAISEVFVKERDLYLCRSLQAAAQPVPNPMSPTGISPRVVVGVVGIGHVPGIVEHWGKVTDADIAPIMRIPPPSFSSKVLKFTFKMTMYGLLGYGAYKCLPASTKSAINSSVHSAVTSVTSILPQKWQK